MASIGVQAFYECTNIKNVEIPESVKIIKPLAFAGCTRLKAVTYFGLEDINGSPDIFQGCDLLLSVNVPMDYKDSSFSGKYKINKFLQDDINQKVTLLAASSACGPNAWWNYASVTLTISGSGVMDNYQRDYP